LFFARFKCSFAWSHAMWKVPEKWKRWYTSHDWIVECVNIVLPAVWR